MKARLIPLTVALVAGLVLVTPSTSAPPAGYSVQIAQQATLVSPTSITVSVVLAVPGGHERECPRRGQPATDGRAHTQGFGFGFTSCTGAKQTLSVTVSGGTFSAGSAFAEATLYSSRPPHSNDDAQDYRVITIS